MAHIIDPNTQTLNNTPLNIRMEGDPGSTPTVISPEYVYVNDFDSNPNTNTKAISNSKNSVSNALKQMKTTKSSNDLLTKIVWNNNENTMGKIAPSVFQFGIPSSAVKSSAFEDAFSITNNIFSTWVKTSDTKGDRAFNNIYISGEVLSDEDDGFLNQDANGDPIYLSGVLSDDDITQDQEIKDSLGIPNEDGIVFQECYNHDEPRLTLTFKSDSSWLKIGGNTTYSYIWDGNKVSGLPTSGTDITKITYSVTSNTPSATQGTVSGTVDTLLSNDSINYDGGTAEVNIGNTKLNGRITGFTFTDADNTIAKTDPRIATITYTYVSENSSSSFSGSGSFKITQLGGDVATPNPTVTYFFSGTSNCTLNKTTQGPQDKTGGVCTVKITANPNSATKGIVSFSSGSKMSVYSGSTLVGTATSSSDGKGNIAVIGGTYTLKFDSINASLPKNTSSRRISFDIDVLTENDANNGSKILNTPMTWGYTQQGYTYTNPYVKFAYSITQGSSTSSGSVTNTFNTAVFNTSLQGAFVIPSNAGDYQGATTNPVISIDKTSTITVPDSGGTISVNCSYTGGTWEPGYTKSTNAKTWVVKLNSVTGDSATSLSTTNAPVSKSITLTQAGATEGENKFVAVTIAGSNPNTAYCSSVNSCTLSNKNSTGSVQYNFVSATQPTRNGFKMELIDGDYTCGDITLNYTKPSGTFTPLSSTLTISNGSLNSNTVKFTRPSVYPSFTISFNSSNSSLVNKNGNATWSETFTDSEETGNWTVDDSGRNIYYSNPSISSGDCSANNGSSTFSGSVTFSSSQSGSSASVSSTITATDQDGNKQTVTVTRSAYNKTGLTYSITCSNSAWTVTSKPSSIGTSGTLSFSGSISTSPNSASSCTITVKIYSSSNSSLVATKTFDVCRKGVYTTSSTNYQWVNNGSSSTSYSLSSGVSLSCSTSGGGNIDYWTSSATVSGSGSISTTSDNVTITTTQPQKQQSQTTTVTHTVDCSGNDSTSSSTDSWTDTGSTRNSTSTSFASVTNGITVQRSTDNSSWEDGSSYSVSPTAGSNGSSTGTTETRYFRAVLRYNGTTVATSTSQSVSVAKYGVTYYNE